MSATTTAAGYLYASGILTKRRDAKRAETLGAQLPVESLKNVVVQHESDGARLVKITYRRKRL